MGAAVPESQSLSYEIDSEGFKLVADQMVLNEPNIRPMLHRQFVAPIMEGNAIIGAITESKAGREAILAKRVIDATGDADVAQRAGAPVFKTPVEEMMAASVMFHVAGVDKQKFMDGIKADPQTYKDWGGGGEWNIETTGKEDKMFSPFLHKPFAQAIKDGMIPPNLNTIAGTWGACHDTGELTYMNLIHMANCDGTDPDSMTTYEIEGRRQGVLISMENGSSVAFALWNLQERGKMFIGAQEAVYTGMIIGEHSRENDLEVNPLKGKKLTNVRASGTDDAVRLTTPITLSLEEAIAYINDDELVEVTPNSIRLRKRYLDPHERKRMSKTY